MSVHEDPTAALDPDDVPTAEARRNLAELLNRVAYGKERVVVTRHGKEIAALVPVDDLDLLERIRSFAARKDVHDALRELDAGDTVSWRELRKELGL